MTAEGGVTIFVGTVISDIDVSMRGRMEVDVDSYGIVEVKYVTPYFGGGSGGGFWGIPAPGTVILVCSPANKGDDWYYMGSVVEPPLGMLGDAEEDEAFINEVDDTGTLTGPAAHADIPVMPDPDIYKSRGRPMKYMFKSPKGHALTLSDQYDPEYHNTKISMESANGKKIELNDSPMSDNVLMRNEHGDKIKISSNYNPPDQGARAITVDSVGPHLYMSRNGGIKIWVNDGSNMDLINTSTGAMREKDSDVSTWGKINMVANNNDIVIQCKEGSATPNFGIPSIFIETEGSESVIQISSNNKINIVAENGIDITSSTGDINMTAETGNIKLSTPAGKIDLN